MTGRSSDPVPAPIHRILVLGANGALGREVVRGALSRGHRVTALVRRADSLSPAEDIQVIEGSVGEQADVVRDAMRGQDAVISALGNHSWLHGRRTVPVMTNAVTNVIAGMVASDVTRLVVPLAWGSGTSADAASLPVRAFTRTFMRRDFADLDSAEHIIMGTPQIDWTIAYFGALADAGAASHDWTSSDRIVTPNPMRISRADVAEFLVSAVDRHRYVRRHVVLNGGTSHS